MARIINPNLKFLTKARTKLRGAILEGSSRSGKTWSSVDFIIYLCSKIETNATIHIIKETYNSFKTTLFEDFNRRFPMYGIRSPTAGKKECHSFQLFGNTVNLLGADSDSKVHGSGSDYFYINEALPVSRAVFDQYEQRCRKFWWMDYNPSVTQHWIFDRLEKRSDVEILRTTFLDNPYISNAEKVKILSYEPWHPEDRHIQDTSKRRPHPVNIKEGTADAYKWNVYGLGLRAAPEGLVFQNVNYIKEFPKDCEKVFYGLDFGYTNDPSALVKIGIKGKDIFAEKLFYGVTPSSSTLQPVLDKFVQKDYHVWADNADRGMVTNMRRAGFKVFAVVKFQGSIKYGIDKLKSYKINLVDCPEWRTEQENYKFREVHGIRLNEPEDKHNHLWDALRYGVMMEVK